MRGVARSSSPSRPRRSSRPCHPRRPAKRCATALPMPWSGAARAVARGHRGALFYVGFLAGGFVLGGLLHALLRRVFPPGAAQGVLTSGVAPALRPGALHPLRGFVPPRPHPVAAALVGGGGVGVARLSAPSSWAGRFPGGDQGRGPGLSDPGDPAGPAPVAPAAEWPPAAARAA